MGLTISLSRVVNLAIGKVMSIKKEITINFFK